MKNLFGKTLVVLIFIFSLLLFAMSGAVYMTHTNWRAKAEAEAKKVEEAKLLLGVGNEEKGPGYRFTNKQYEAKIEAEENFRNQVVEAMTSEVELRKNEYDAYCAELKKNHKLLSEKSRTMLQFTIYLLRKRLKADEQIVKVQNERNSRIRTMHEYINNMNKIEDLRQQILTLQKRERSLTLDQRGSEN